MVRQPLGVVWSILCRGAKKKAFNPLHNPKKSSTFAPTSFGGEVGLAFVRPSRLAAEANDFQKS